jgi:hypothetical protein
VKAFMTINLDHKFRKGQKLPKEVTYGGNLETGEEILAVAVKLTNGQMNFFLTLGKPFYRRRLDEIAKLVFDRSEKFSLDGSPQETEVCYSLFDASNEPYFFEGLTSLVGTISKIRTKKDLIRIKRECQDGQHLYFLGSRKNRSRSKKNYFSMRNFQ